MNYVNPNKVQTLIENGFHLDIGSTINAGIDLVKREAGMYIAYTLVYIIIASIVGQIQYLDQLVTPLLIAGFYLVTHQYWKNESVEFGDFFKGFNYIGPLLIQHLIYLAIVILVVLPAILSAHAAGLFNTEILAGDYIPELGIVTLLSFFLAFIGFLYVSTIYFFAPFLVLFGSYQPWEAMETSRKVVIQNFWAILGLMIVGGLFIIAGLLFCVIGVLFTLPAAYAAFYFAFNRIFDLSNAEDLQDDIFDHLVE